MSTFNFKKGQVVPIDEVLAILGIAPPEEEHQHIEPNSEKDVSERIRFVEDVTINVTVSISD